VNADGNENDGFPLQKRGVALVIYILPGLGMSLQSEKRELTIRGEILFNYLKILFILVNLTYSKTNDFKKIFKKFIIKKYYLNNKLLFLVYIIFNYRIRLILFAFIK